MQCAILSSVAYPALPYFPHYLINGTVLEKKITEHKMCVLIISIVLSGIPLILRIIRRHTLIDVHRYNLKYQSFLSDFNESLIFSTDFRNTPISNFTKIRSMAAELFHGKRRTDGRRDMTKLVVFFAILRSA
jgi:hypothetical protein